MRECGDLPFGEYLSLPYDSLKQGNSEHPEISRTRRVCVICTLPKMGTRMI